MKKYNPYFLYKKIYFIFQLASVGDGIISKSRLLYETFRLECRFAGRPFSCRLAAAGRSAPFLFSGTLEELYTLHEIFVGREYKPRHDEPLGIIVDLGGNTGLATLWFSLLFPEALIETFEPNPELFETLIKNLPSNAKAFKKAVVGKEGPVIFFTSTHALSSSIYKISNSQRIEADGTTLDNILERTGGIDLLKIDIEGAEYEALLSCLQIEKIKEIVGEVHPTKAKRQNEELRTYLNRTHTVEMGKEKGYFYATLRH